MSSQLFSWMNPKLEIKETQKYGKAVKGVFQENLKIYRKTGKYNKATFAKEDIKIDEMLFVLGGYILTIEDDNKMKGVIADKALEISDYFFIGPRKASDIDRMPQSYVNHSCDPNSGFKGQIFLVAMRDIKSNEEITFDYAMCMNPHPDSNTYFSMECLCGSSYCRKIITEDDYKRPELQKKYDGYFQWYLQEKINKLNADKNNKN